MNSLQVNSIMYVEDDEDIREQLSSFLKRFCTNLHVAKDGLEGVALYKTCNPDIVVSDIKMPNMDGIEMSKKIIELNKNQHIIFITAHSESNFFMNAIDMQVDGYILKPLDLRLLKNKLTKIIKSIHIESDFKNQQELLQNISLLQDDMLVVYKDDKPIFTNKKFIKFFEVSMYDNLQSLSDTFIKHSDFFVPKHKNNWTKEIQSLSDERRVVAIFDHDTLIPKSYLVNVKYIKEQNHLIIAFSEITNLTIEKMKFEKKAYIDELTNIANRAKFNEELDKEIQRYKRDKLPLSLVMFDIDHFKSFNDTYGHQIGDDILAGLSSLVQRLTRKTDLFARWGGEEFLMILTNTNLNSAVKVAQNLRKEIENYSIKGDLGVTCSFGVTQIGETDDEKTFLKRVDKALYLAKNSGRNRVEEL